MAALHRAAVARPAPARWSSSRARRRARSAEVGPPDAVRFSPASARAAARLASSRPTIRAACARSAGAASRRPSLPGPARAIRFTTGDRCGSSPCGKTYSLHELAHARADSRLGDRGDAVVEHQPAVGSRRWMAPKYAAGSSGRRARTCRRRRSCRKAVARHVAVVLQAHFAAVARPAARMRSLASACWFSRQRDAGGLTP